MENDFEINIAHIYPELLNAGSDTGNIYALQKRLEWRNIRVNVDNISVNDDIDYSKYDIYFIGDGQEKQKIVALNEIQKHKTELKKLADNGIVMLGISAGYQILGNYYQNKSGEKYDGLSLLDIYTLDNEKRLTGNVTLKTDFLSPETIVGFENHTGLTYLENDTKPLGKIITGEGNNSTDKTEGARNNNVFGTYLHGAILPKNPAFCDYLLERAIQNKTGDNNYVISAIDDVFENLTHKELIKIAH